MTFFSYFFLSVLKDVPSRIRTVLHRTVFSDINAISEVDMSAILFGLVKHVYLAPEDEFYEPMNQKHFFVHRMDRGDIVDETLVRLIITPVIVGFLLQCTFILHKSKLTAMQLTVFFQFIPTEAVHGLRFPFNGKALLYKNGVVLVDDKGDIDCQYHDNGSMINFSQGWSDFAAAAGIVECSLLLVKLELLQYNISLNFLEIIN